MLKGAFKFYFFAFFVLNALVSFGQYYYYNDKYYDNDIVFEVGGSIGAMNAITDLGGQGKNTKKYFNEINWKTTNNVAGLYVGAMYQDIIGLRLEAAWGGVKSYDSLLQKGTPRYNRNLSFKSEIRELSLLAEFHPTMLKFYEDNVPVVSPYAVVGVGWYSFNPQGNLNGQWIDLQPLRTEGQGFSEFPDRRPYKLKQANICFGLGIKYEILESVNLRLEWLHRYLFTDYLDDVSQSYIDPSLFSKYLPPLQASQAKIMYKRGIRNNKNRGQSQNTDAYFSINFKVGIMLGRTSR
jgi:hypothetical protein